MGKRFLFVLASELCNPLLRTSRNWSRRNTFRNCFWDSYWGSAGQLSAIFFPSSLVIVPEVFAKVTRPSFLSGLEFYTRQSTKIKIEHSFISKLLKTRQYSLMSSRVPLLKDRVSAIPGWQLSLSSFRLFSGPFSVDITVLRSKARKRVYYSSSYMSPERWLCFNLALCELIIFQGTGPGGFQALPRLQLF